MSFCLLGPEDKWKVDVRLIARDKRPILIEFTPSDQSVPKKILQSLKKDLFIAIQVFEEKFRKTTLYFAWIKGEPVILEKVMQRKRNLVYRMLTESMLFFFIIFIAASMLLFIFLAPFAPILLVLIQFVILLFADKIVARMGDWEITEEKNNIHIFQYHMSKEEYEEFNQRFDRKKLLRIKSLIYEKTLAVGRLINCETISEVFNIYGFECIQDKMKIKVFNIYDMISEAARLFKMSTPKIVVANNIIPNAAASGISPRNGVILLTTGLLIQLENDEIFSVIGHEFSHLKSRDPLVLFGLTSAEYLLRFYIFWPLLVYYGFFYLFFAMSIVYFFAKFFEGRADLEAAITIGRPEVFAEALRKIGFQKLRFERVQSYKIQGWLGWDPHPPMYFRIERLETLDPSTIKHPLLQSIRDNIRGLTDALG